LAFSCTRATQHTKSQHTGFQLTGWKEEEEANHAVGLLAVEDVECVARVEQVGVALVHGLDRLLDERGLHLAPALELHQLLHEVFVFKSETRD
jgi:hypothetical protein